MRGIATLIPVLLALCSYQVVSGAQPMLVAQEEGDVDETYDAYGQDTDEMLDYDEAIIQKDPVVDSLLADLRWLGHASFLISDSLKIYIDPFNLPKGLPKADLILITHDHYDHFSPEDVAKIAKPTTTIVSIKQVIEKLKNGFKHIYEVEPWDTLDIAGIRIETVPAYNVGKKFHPKERGYVGFVIHTSRSTIYHAGDTHLIPEMRHVKTDVALLPVGGKYTMNAREAAKAAELIMPKVAIPMHYGSIVGKRADAELFAALCKNAGRVKVRILKSMGREVPVKALKPEEGVTR